MKFGYFSSENFLEKNNQTSNLENIMKTIQITRPDGTPLKIKIPRVINYSAAEEKLSARQIETIKDFHKFLIKIIMESGIVLPDNILDGCGPFRFGQRNNNDHFFYIPLSKKEGSLMLKVTVKNNRGCSFEFCKYHLLDNNKNHQLGNAYSMQTIVKEIHKSVFSAEHIMLTLDKFICLLGDIIKVLKVEMKIKVSISNQQQIIKQNI